MIMGGVWSKVLVAILLRPPEKNLCKQLLGSYLVLDPPLPLEFLPSGRGGGYGHFLELHNSEKM